MATPGTNPVMPARGHPTAPKFSGNNPRELQRYFDELDYLFTSCGIATDDAKKRYAVRYIDYETEDGWKQLGEFRDAQRTFDEFKAAVYKLYPGADDDRKWTLEDLDLLIGETSRIGFRHKMDLGDYHRKFLIITGFLVSKNRMSDNEVKRSFVRGFPRHLWDRVKARLQIVDAAHHPDDPWDVQAVFDATSFVLHGNLPPTYSSSTSSTSPPPPPPQPAPEPPIKKEELYALFEQFSQSIAKAIETKRPTSNDRPRRPCFYDGGNHFVKDCQILKKHLEKGWIKRSDENRIVLPDGKYIERSLPGKNLAERVELLNKKGASQSQGSSLFFSIADEPSQSPSRSISSSFVQDKPSTRIEELEREIFQLRKRQIMDAVEIPRQPRQAPQVDRPASTNATQQSANAPSPESLAKSKKPSSKDKAPATPTPIDKPSSSIHPYAAISENRYLPPHERNFAAKPNKEVAYRNAAPIQNPSIINDIFDKTMKSQCVTLTPEEIMSIAPEVRAKVKEAITPKRIGNEALSKSNPQQQQQQIVHNNQDDNLAMLDDSDDEADNTDNKAQFQVLPFNGKNLPLDAIIIPDPIEQHLQTLSPEEVSKKFKVAQDSFSLQSIHTRVNFKDTLEAVVDGGSSIISMSEAACHHLRLTYDPSIYINMENANGTMDRTLGLARNVHCKIGGINLYFQIHILRNPAYDMLLGRPFDVLTRSTVQNFVDGNQTITIYDPNSSYVCTVPTFPRSRPRFVSQPSRLPSRHADEKEKDFR